MDNKKLVVSEEFRSLIYMRGMTTLVTTAVITLVKTVKLIFYQSMPFEMQQHYNFKCNYDNA